jgi:hypothetical protein
MSHWEAWIIRPNLVLCVSYDLMIRICKLDTIWLLRSSYSSIDVYLLYPLDPENQTVAFGFRQRFGSRVHHNTYWLKNQSTNVFSNNKTVVILFIIYLLTLFHWGFCAFVVLPLMMSNILMLSDVIIHSMLTEQSNIDKKGLVNILYWTFYCIDLPYHGYFLQLSNFCGILRIGQIRRNCNCKIFMNAYLYI